MFWTLSHSIQHKPPLTGSNSSQSKSQRWTKWTTTLQEIVKAIRQRKRVGKLQELMASPPRNFGNKEVQLCMWNYFNCLSAAWNKENSLKIFVMRFIITLYSLQEQRGKSDCSNYRGITLLSIAGKMLARVLLNRLLPLLKNTFQRASGGFRASRSTADMVFALRQMQEKCWEQNMGLYAPPFVDLTKAFDTVSKRWTLEIPGKARLPTKVPYHGYPVTQRSGRPGQTWK